MTSLQPKPNNKMRNATTEDIVFDPPQVANLAVKKADEIKNSDNSDRLYTNLPREFDDYFVMWRRQKVVGVLGDTSHYKTGFMTYCAREAAKHLKADQGEVGIYCTWEDSVEDFALADIANFSNISVGSIYNGSMSEAQRNDMISASIKRAAFPLWLIGHSEDRTVRRPRLTMRDINSALEYIVDVQKKQVKFLVMDYLQRISYADMKVHDPRSGFVEIMNLVKDAALNFNTGVMIGSQVQREIRERKNRQPQMHDAQETSNLEQTCDGIVSVQMPVKHMERDSVFTKLPGFGDVKVTNRLLAVQVVKQKKGATGKLFLYDAMYETNSIARYTGYDGDEPLSTPKEYRDITGERD